MRALHVVHLDKARPAVILTRDHARPLLKAVTVAPITSTVRGIAIEVPVSRHNGLDHAAVINCDNVATVEASRVGKLIGHLFPEQEEQLALALMYAYDLRLD